MTFSGAWRNDRASHGIGEVLKGGVLARDRAFQMLWLILPDEAFQQHVAVRDAYARKCLQQGLGVQTSCCGLRDGLEQRAEPACKAFRGPGNGCP